MDIPVYVKIKGKKVLVNSSARGYVKVGGSISEISDSDKEKNRMINDKLLQIKHWRHLMYKTFLEALKKERLSV